MTKYANATPQDALIEIFSDVYLLRGSIKIAPLLQINRNMLVIRDGDVLTLVNAVRMNEQNLKHLDRLGKVKHVIRLGDFHGLDDQFYIDRYAAQFWSQAKHDTYKELVPTKIIDQQQTPPIANSEFFIFTAAQYPEAAILLKEHKLLITTDSVQYWDDHKYISFISRIVLLLMGFRLTLFIGGPWLKRVSADKNSLQADFQRLLQLDFNSIVAAHGNVLKDTAKTELEKVVAKTFKE